MILIFFDLGACKSEIQIGTLKLGSSGVALEPPTTRMYSRYTTQGVVGLRVHTEMQKSLGVWAVYLGRRYS